jgi:transcriptional regulator with PAS, ATPase and Fis domain
MTTELQQIKQRFGIIGNNPRLNRAIEVALQVAPTELSVLITGESGVGKEIMPQVIHNYSARKHGNYIAVNCGAIPEGTIDSELFGHEKGSFTGATESRKGYFEVADGGTIFLDEVAELPLQTQVRLLRVLETGEFIRVGSSKVQKTDVRIVAATNVNIPEAIKKGRFREDLYYRLNTVPIQIPALRERKEDIHLLFRKFASDFAEKYRMPVLKLEDDAVQVLINYRWPGNIRQLKNVTEQISVIEQQRIIDAFSLQNYLPSEHGVNLPMPVAQPGQTTDFSERELLYKVLFDLKKDMNEMKKIVGTLLQGGKENFSNEQQEFISTFYGDNTGATQTMPVRSTNQPVKFSDDELTIVSHDHDVPHTIEIEESLSLEDKEVEMIKKALQKHRGKRRNAASELGISERTLYRKIKEFNIKE